MNKLLWENRRGSDNFSSCLGGPREEKISDSFPEEQMPDLNVILEDRKA
jgi:hypothetical protein